MSGRMDRAELVKAIMRKKPRGDNQEYQLSLDSREAEDPEISVNRVSMHGVSV